MANLEQLIEDLSTNEALRAKIAAVATEDEFNAVLESAGYSVSMKDIARRVDANGADISDEDLDAACGGGEVYVNSFMMEAYVKNHPPLPPGYNYVCF